jgi:DNA-binding NarL/FixJ family response regulator
VFADVNGIDLLRRIVAARPSAGVLMLSERRDCEYAIRALAAGASGYLGKPTPAEALIEAVNIIARGRCYIGPDVGEPGAPQPEDEPVGTTSLSSREREILKLLAQGWALEEIGRRLGVSAKTVANRQSVIKAKLGADTALQLMVIARRLGLC